MGRTLVASAAEFALTRPAFRPATRAGAHFAGFFEVQFDFAAGLVSLPTIHCRGRPRFSSDEKCFNLTCPGHGLEKHILETS
jgi:hypothetical protein